MSRLIMLFTVLIGSASCGKVSPDADSGTPADAAMDAELGFHSICDKSNGPISADRIDASLTSVEGCPNGTECVASAGGPVVWFCAKDGGVAGRCIFPCGSDQPCYLLKCNTCSAYCQDN